MRPRLIAAICIAFGCGIGAGLLLISACGQAAAVTVRFADPPQAGAAIRVYVSGAVRNPGVYSLHDGDRLVDAVEAAGGPAPDADTEAINFAQRMRDETHVQVPQLGEQPGPKASSGPQASSSSSAQPVDINRADANLLRSLPGIGATRAQAIVTSRQKDGPFKSSEDLLRRRILPQSAYDQVKDLIAVAP